ncbi:hypothetical protein KFK09_016044 [Dendrobium nobile]|uniref:Uncharacterized protein n=1 Tax=Dendrobium nobile TaxID=94219 RepID=A0A8T3B667_DENNO|nr:hypothetical protein KFK09_016044 [Dendrobium nobile]
MDKRRSISRVVSHGFRPAGAAATSICPSSPSSGGESPTNTTSTLHSRSPRRRKHFPETPRKVLRKQRSAEDLQLRGGLWPSAKSQPGAPNTNVIAATLQDHLINDRKNEEEEEEELRIVGFETHAASTFSSRQRARSNTSAFEINISNGRGRRYRPSLSSSASKKKKKQPGTPPSPSSSSSSSSSFSGPNIPSAARLPFSDENVLAERRSEFGLDFPSTESDHRDAGTNSRSRAPIKIAGKVVRRSGSPVRRSKSPVMRNSRSPPVPRNSRSPPVLRQPTSPAKEMISGGMGKIISMGLGGLFRRKSFSGNGVTVALTTTTTKSSISVAKETANNGLSGRRGMAEVVGSPARGAQAAVELQHELRMAHNHLMQWRFVNGRTVAINSNKWAMAQVRMVDHACI